MLPVRQRETGLTKDYRSRCHIRVPVDLALTVKDIRTILPESGAGLPDGRARVDLTQTSPSHRCLRTMRIAVVGSGVSGLGATWVSHVPVQRKDQLAHTVHPGSE